MTATVLAGWLGVIEQAASRYRLDFAGLLQRSGIDPELLQQGTARVPQRKISELMQLAMVMKIKKVANTERAYHQGFHR